MSSEIEPPPKSGSHSMHHSFDMVTWSFITTLFATIPMVVIMIQRGFGYIVDESHPLIVVAAISVLFIPETFLVRNYPKTQATLLSHQHRARVLCLTMFFLALFGIIYGNCHTEPMNAFGQFSLLFTSVFSVSMDRYLSFQLEENYNREQEGNGRPEDPPQDGGAGDPPEDGAGQSPQDGGSPPEAGAGDPPPPVEPTNALIHGVIVVLNSTRRLFMKAEDTL